MHFLREQIESKKFLFNTVLMIPIFILGYYRASQKSNVKNTNSIFKQ